MLFKLRMIGRDGRFGKTLTIYHNEKSAVWTIGSSVSTSRCVNARCISENSYFLSCGRSFQKGFKLASLVNSNWILSSEGHFRYLSGLGLSVHDFVGHYKYEWDPRTSWYQKPKVVPRVEKTNPRKPYRLPHDNERMKQMFALSQTQNRVETGSMCEEVNEEGNTNAVGKKIDQLTVILYY